MTLGVSTVEAHLDPRGQGGDAREIRWVDFLAWNREKVPAFAGRYFVGSEWQWAHGEGSELLDVVGADAELRIAPIQRSDPTRQAALERLAERYGGEDAEALGSAIQACFDVGDLELVKSPVYVYLEVDDGTALSVDYWKAWCSGITNWMGVVTKRLAGGLELPALFQGLLPCILCSWPLDPATRRFTVAPPVRACLDAAAPAASVLQPTRCFGFWARAPDAAYRVAEPALDWSRFAEYRQPLPGAEEPVPVPLRVWRYAEAADPQRPIPEIGKLTLDATRAAIGQPDAAYDGMLRVRTWSAPNARPTVIGVDKGSSIAAEIGCLAARSITVRHTPERFDGGRAGDGPPLDPPLSEPIRFVFRYYSAARDSAGQRRKDLAPGEARRIAAAGAEIGAIWQAPVLFGDSTTVHLTTPGNGRRDALNAFSFAANRVRQPAHTPVYFAVDSDVTDGGVDGDGDPVPTFQQIIAYFTEIRQGHDDYLQAQRRDGLDPVPYRVGAYTVTTVMNALYARGLATHFWQAFPPFWGDDGPFGNFTAWPHANLWTVCMATAGSPIPPTGVLTCRRAAVWWIGFNAKVRGGRFRIAVGAPPGRSTDPLPFDTDAAAVQAALRLVQGVGNVDVERSPRPRAINGFLLFFPTDPGPVSLDTAELVLLPDTRVGRDILAQDQGFVDINVGWGDQGCWRPRREGALGGG